MNFDHTKFMEIITQNQYTKRPSSSVKFKLPKIEFTEPKKIVTNQHKTKSRP